MKFSGPYKGDVRGYVIPPPSKKQGFRYGDFESDTRRGSFAGARYRSFGDIGCSEFDTALANLKGLIDQSALGNGYDDAYQAAVDYYNAQSGTLYNGSLFMLGQSCTDAVTQANQLANSLVSASTATQLPIAPSANNPPAVPPPTNPLNPLSYIPSWVLPVAAGLIGLGLLAWLASSASKIWPKRKTA